MTNYGIPEITEDYIRCEICKNTYQTLPRHIEKIHKINAWDYKELYGYNKNQPLECLRLTEVRRQHSYKNKLYEKNFEGWRQLYAFQKGEPHPQTRRKQYLIQLAKRNAEVSRNPIYTAKRSKKLKERAIKEHWIDRINNFKRKEVT